MKKIYLLSLLFYSILSFSQTYKPLDTLDYKERKAFLESYSKNNLQYTQFIKSKYQGEHSRYLLKNYEHFQQELRERIKDKDYYHKGPFNNYLQSLIVKMRAKNPIIPNNLLLLVDKDNVPNAATVGDGIVVVNMGLFTILDNEEQLIAVLGHEIGHQILEHSTKWQSTKFLRSKDSKAQTQEIVKAKHNKADKAFSLYKNILYGNSIERRKHETEADSLGYVLFSNMVTHKFEYKNALKNLKIYDTISPLVVEKEFYKKIFHTPTTPFKESWLKMEDFSSYNYNHYKNKIDKDSISSHPEMEIRIDKIAHTFNELNAETPAITNNDTEFAILKKIAKWEIVPNYFYRKEYGMGIYYLLQAQSHQLLNDEKYFDTWMGKYFSQIYEARKNYTLNRYIDRLEPKEQDESYQQFLSFMWNLSLEDIKSISDYYTKKSS